MEDKDLMFEPMKQFLETAINSASSFIAKFPGVPGDTQIKLEEFYTNNVYTLKLTYSEKVLYVKTYMNVLIDEVLDIKKVAYGALLTEIITTYVIVCKQVKDQQETTDKK